jgi:hypothetical protein
VSQHTGADGPQWGTIGEEVARLLFAVQSWASTTLGERAPTDSVECRFCPVCRLLAALAGDRSGLATTLGGAADALLEALRTLLDPDPTPPDVTSAGESTAGRPGGGVQRIEIS